MKNKKLMAKGLCLFSAFFLSSCGVSVLPLNNGDSFIDPITYDKELVLPLEAGKQMNMVPVSAEETEVKKVILHYLNEDGKNLSRRLYIWNDNVDGDRLGDIAATEVNNQAIKFVIDFEDPTYAPYAGTDKLKFIVKFAGMWAGQSADIVLKYSDYTIDSDGVCEIWCLPAEGGMIEVFDNESDTKFDKAKTAKFTNWDTIAVNATAVPTVYRLYAFDKNYLDAGEAVQRKNKELYMIKSGQPTSSNFTIKLNYNAHINVKYVLETEYSTAPGRAVKCNVTFEYLYNHPFLNERFNQFYTYDGELGAIYTKERTTFRLWAPTTASCRLNLYRKGHSKSIRNDGVDTASVYNMVYRPGGIWEVTIDGDLKDSLYRYYTFTVNNSNGEVETADPYAHGAGLNGERSMVYIPEELNPEGWDDLSYDKLENGPQDLSVYEIHIRDLTSDETWVSNNDNARGTYNAFAESGTTYSKDGKTVTTGYDHIKELGVNAIQIMPVFDQDNNEIPDKMKYNWGYNPLNYNVVEGGYSSDPYDGAVRIREFKNLIMKYAEKSEGKDDQIRCIMDVVYNHVSSANNSCFTKVMPRYYFRYDSQWNLYDGSGCNNEVKSEAKMMRKYIVDSLKFWASEYKIKGFRFDLMGLIDTDTLKAAKEALYEIDPDIYMYGEGWTSGGFHGTDGTRGGFTDKVYSELMQTSESSGYVGAFNDLGRNATKGSNGDGYNNNPYPQWGFNSKSSDVGNLSSSVTDMMKGIYSSSVGANPKQTVNYLSCHDNYTLWDQLQYTLADSHYEVSVPNQPQKARMPQGRPSTEAVINASISSHAAIMSSNGVGFMLGGEELYRTKAHTQEEIDTLVGTTIRPFPDYCHYTTDPEVTKATDDVKMFDDIITHNSYKSSDAVNSFKWDRKIKVGDTSTYEYNKVWQDILKTRKTLNKVSFPDNCDNPNGDFSCWYAGDTPNGCNLVGFRNGDTYFFYSGKYSGTKNISFGLANNVDLVYTTNNSFSLNANSITLPQHTFVCVRSK